MRTVLALNFMLLALKASAKGLSSGLDIEHVEHDLELEVYLREAIENFRGQMKEGIPAINMSVLDPLELENLNKKVDKNLATMDLQIKTITVKGLSSFQICRILPDLKSLFLRVNLTLPNLVSLGKYELTGKLLKIFPLTGKGNFEINITKGEIDGTGKLYFINETLQMRNLKLKWNFSWEEMKICLENFLGGGTFSNILQSLIPFIGRSVFEKLGPTIFEMMEEALIARVNEKLKHPEVQKIVDRLFQNISTVSI